MTPQNDKPARFGAILAITLCSAAWMMGCSDNGSTTATSTGPGGAGGMGSSSSGAGGSSACGPNQVSCDGTCTNTMVDPMNCGACAKACAAGELCSVGVCSLSCGGGTTQCGNTCIDISNDPLNCGGCDKPCAADEVCSDGMCGLSCGGGSTKCANICVDVTNDPLNCGGCGTKCSIGEVCSAGMCRLNCAGGTTKCGNLCVEIAVDPANCGTCGNACAAGEVCSVGKCGLTCGGTTTKCGSSCVDTTNDPANCGACGAACGPYPSATGVCAAGSCAALCASGSANCNGALADGCESMPASDPANCGFCGNVCPSKTNAASTCTNNVCGFSCNMGFGDCNNDPTDGCETDVQTTVAHCGMCGNACSVAANASTTCSNGSCGFTCNMGFNDCNNNPADGCESNSQSDSQNCGMCGVVCVAGQACINSTCQASNIRQLSGTNVVDFIRGSTHNGVFADPVTGKVYWHVSYQGSSLSVYPDMTNFANNTNATTLNLSAAFEGTYHAALNGFLYYNQANTNTMVKVDAVTGGVVTSAPLANAGFHNMSHFNWGGYSDIDFYTDTGNLLYVMYAPAGGNIQVSRIEPNSLGILQTWNIPRVKTNTGFAFLVNGNFYVGNTFNSPAINGKLNLATNTYDAAYSNSFTPVPGDYIALTMWDPGSKYLIEVTNSHHLLYPNVQ